MYLTKKINLFVQTKKIRVHKIVKIVKMMNNKSPCQLIAIAEIYRK